MEFFKIIITFASPFIAALLTYFLTIKKSKKDVDLEKEKALNQVLSDLLSSRFYLSRIKVMDLMLTSEVKETIFPVNRIPDILLNSGLFEPADFSQLDKSIHLLKQYDAIIHYRLEGIGSNFEIINNNYILPVLSSQKNGQIIISSSIIRPLLSETLTSIDDSILDVVSKMNLRVKKEVDNILSRTIEDETNKLIVELENTYFNSMSGFLLENGIIIPKSEFKDFAKTDEFKKILDLQLQVLKKGNLDKTLKIIEDYPNISFDEITKKLVDKLK